MSHTVCAMKVVILAGGLGTRLSEETEVRMTFALDGAHETLGLRHA